MRLSFCALLAVLLAFAGIAASAAEGPTDRPEPADGRVTSPRGGLVCDSPRFDFGEAYPDQVIAHTFVLKNTGTNAIRIQGVRSGCGCTTTTLATNCLTAGQSTELATDLDLKGRKGAQQKSIYVESDDPGCARLHLQLAGAVIVPVDALPEGVHFGTLGREGTVEREVSVSARSNITFQVKGVTCSSPQFAARVETQEVGRVYRIKIQSLGPRLLGTSQAAVQVETDCPRMPVVSIPVAAFVAGDIVPAPATLILVQAGTNAMRTYYVSLYSPAGKAFAIKRVDLPSQSVTCKYEPTATDRQRLEINVTGSLSGLNGKALRVETDLASMREVTIPLRVIGSGIGDEPR